MIFIWLYFLNFNKLKKGRVHKNNETQCSKYKESFKKDPVIVNDATIDDSMDSFIKEPRQPTLIWNSFEN